MMKVEVKGTKEMRDILETVAPREALNLSRNVVHGVASEVAKVAKEEAPEDEGVLRRAIKAVRRRMRFGRVQSDVVIQHGAGARHDAFYGRMVERGTSTRPARPFILPALRRIEQELPDILRAQFVKKLTAAIKRARKRAARR